MRMMLHPHARAGAKRSAAASVSSVSSLRAATLTSLVRTPARPIAARLITCPSASGSAANALVQWLESKGGLNDKSAAVPVATDGGVKLQTTRPVKDGEALFSVPEEAFVNAKVVDTSPLGQYLAGQKVWIKLALFIIAERANPQSAYAPFLDLIPEVPECTMFWTDEQLALLEGSQLLASTLNYQQYVEMEAQELQAAVFSQHPDVFPAEVFNPESLLWGFGVLRSCTFPPVNDGDDLALVPLADLTSHQVSSTTQTEIKSGGLLGGGSRSLVLQADRAYEAGEDVVMNYGIFKSDSAVALDYGVGGGTEGGAFYLTLALPQDDRFFDDKADIAEQAGLAEAFEFSFSASADPPPEMATFLRLMNLGSSDAFLLEALFRNQAWDLISLPVSEENERNVATSMVEGCAEALQGYCSSIEDDLQLLGSGQLQVGTREYVAVRARLGEKQALKSCRRYFEKALKTLDETEFYQERRLKGLGLLDDDGATTYESMMGAVSHVPRGHAGLKHNGQWHVEVY